jgi:RNA recognition motif-containing protein
MAQDPCQLFVGNLPEGADEDAMTEYFSKFGTVDECRLLRMQNTGESRGFGFVTFSRPDEADFVYKTRDEHDIMGKRVFIHRAMASEKDPRHIMVEKLPLEADEVVLSEYFAQFGMLDLVKLVRERDGTSKGYGFLKYATIEEAKACLNQWETHSIMGQWVEVKTVTTQEAGLGADADNTVFIGGLHKEKTTEESLRKHFDGYSIDSINLGRGVAYVTFSSNDAMEEVCKELSHVIDGNLVSIKPYTLDQNSEDDNRLFIGGLRSSIKDSHLIDYFKHYGPVKAKVVLDEQGQSKKFGMVQFENIDAALKCYADYYLHYIHNGWVEVKPYGKKNLKGKKKGGKGAFEDVLFNKGSFGGKIDKGSIYSGKSKGYGKGDKGKDDFSKGKDGKDGKDGFGKAGKGKDIYEGKGTPLWAGATTGNPYAGYGKSADKDTFLAQGYALAQAKGAKGKGGYGPAKPSAGPSNQAQPYYINN